MEKQTLNELDLAKKLLDEHKAEEIAVVDVRGKSPFASYYVIATCLNPRALGAMQETLEEGFESLLIEEIRKDGTPDSGWVVIQAGEVVVHLFLNVNRKEIDLEGLLNHEPKSAH